jgi:peptide/nickel transport system substrate-binding protein
MTIYYHKYVYFFSVIIPLYVFYILVLKTLIIKWRNKMILKNIKFIATTALYFLLFVLYPTFSSAEEVRKLTLWAREQGAAPAAHTAALLIAQTWEDLGLEVEVKAVPWPQMADQIWYKRGGESSDEDSWDVTMWQMVSRPERSDPDEFTVNLFHTTTAPKGYNFIGYLDPAYDAIADESRRTMDPVKRKVLIDQAQQHLADAAVNAYLVHPLMNYAYDNTQFKDGTAIEQAGMGIKNIWTYLNIEPIGGNKDLIAQSPDEIQAINPFFISGGTDSWITENIWDRMLRIGSDGIPVPWAAESYNWVDETTIDVTLRPGMKWHDGNPVTTEDVIFSFSATQDIEMIPMYARFVKNITSMEDLGGGTVRFHLDSANAAFLTSTLAKLNLVPKHYYGPLLDALKGTGNNAETILEEKRIGSGPFKFVDWRPREQVVLTANTDHFNPPKIERWIVKEIPNVEAALGMFRKGEINFISYYTGDPTVLEDITAKDGDITLRKSVDIGFQYLAFNHRRAPFNDVHLRRALSLSIDRDMMVNAAWNGNAVRAGSHVSPALSYYHKEGIENFETGIDLAKQILEEGGYKIKGGKLHYPDGVSEQYPN